MIGGIRAIMIRARLIWLCLILGLSSSSAFAFGTINSLGQHAEHEKITRLGLAKFGIGRKTLDEIAGKRGTYGAVGAPDRLNRGLISVSEAHCDNGDSLDRAGYPQSKEKAAAQLSKCRRWIFRWFNKAVETADKLVDKNGRLTRQGRVSEFSCKFDGKRGSVKCRVLGAMGVVFHAAQDFYSHTNWTDINPGRDTGRKNPPGLGHRGPAPWLDPGINAKFPTGLISGCFGGVPEIAFCRKRVKHSYLNKDNGKINPETGAIGAGKTDRGKVNSNFSRAVKAAIKDTENKWRYFETSLVRKYGERRGKIMICVLRNDRSSDCDK